MENQLLLKKSEAVESESAGNCAQKNSAAIGGDQDKTNPISDEIPVQKHDYRAIVKKKRVALFFMRAFDFFASLFGLLILTPLFLFVALLIKCTSKGPVFYKQQRVGKDCKLFAVVKFRTMVFNADKQGSALTVGNDARITAVGKFLRRVKIDELPQLFNVLVGQMSLVGPRPFALKLYDKYIYNEEQKLQFLIRPGITGLASLRYSHEAEELAQCAPEDVDRYFCEVVVPKKAELNFEYIRKMNVFYNIAIIFRTLFSILKK